MLRDVFESRRIHKTIQERMSGTNPLFNIQSYITSAEYWPKNTDKEFQLPDKLEAQFENYTKYTIFYEITFSGLEKYEELRRVSLRV